MLDISEIDKAVSKAQSVMPWITGITSPEQYQELIATMEVLIEDYDAHQPVIDLMFPVIERYEEAEQFSEFNQAIDKLEPGIAMLRVIIDQHQLTLSDFKEEIYTHLRKKFAAEKKEGQTDEQFIYKTRKKGFGEFKSKFWNLSKEIREGISKELESKTDFLFEQLAVKNTRADVVKTVEQTPIYPNLESEVKACL